MGSSTRLPFEILPGEGSVRIKVGKKTYTGIEISAIILRELKMSAERALKCPVTRAVITVPAYFNDSQRQATRAAGRLAGLDVLRILNEPTAASLAYGLVQKKEGVIAVYDLGGGTFDVSLLKLKNGIFEVLATNGDTALGGDDLDQIFVKVAAQAILAERRIDIFSDATLHAALLESAERTKIALSQATSATFSVSVQGQSYEKVWSIEEFETVARPLLERTVEPCRQALRDAKLKLGDLSDLVLVGGPSRLRIVQEYAQKIFGRAPNVSVHPDEVVAEGAAIQADILAGHNQDLLLLDVVPLSLGLETYGGLMESLIPRNTRIPTVARESFTTFAENQTGVDIHVLQGEREKVSENRSLARFKLTGIQPSPAGLPRIEVTFLVDADGILQVSARDLKTGREQSIEVRPSFGLTDAEVEKMLLAGAEQAQQDRNYRLLVEARNHAEPVIQATEKRISAAIQLLPPNEVKVIQDALEKLKSVLSQSEAQTIQRATDHLNQSTQRLSEVLLTEALRTQKEALANPQKLSGPGGIKSESSEKTAPKNLKTSS